MCMTPEKGTKLFKSLVDNLVQLDRVTPKEADGIYAEYKRYLDGCNKKPSTVSEVQQKRKRTWWILLLWRGRLEWLSQTKQSH